MHPEQVACGPFRVCGVSRQSIAQYGAVTCTNFVNRFSNPWTPQQASLPVVITAINTTRGSCLWLIIRTIRCLALIHFLPVMLVPSEEWLSFTRTNSIVSHTSPVPEWGPNPPAQSSIHTVGQLLAPACCHSASALETVPFLPKYSVFHPC